MDALYIHPQEIFYNYFINCIIFLFIIQLFYFSTLQPQSINNIIPLLQIWRGSLAGQHPNRDAQQYDKTTVVKELQLKQVKVTH